MTPIRKPRPIQPKCAECHHPKSFHGGGTSRCRALGCECLAWVEAEVEVPMAAEA